MQEPNWYYPWVGMRVGDSFFIPTLKPEVMLYKINLNAKEFGIKIRTAIRVEEQVMGVRVWRVE